MYNRYCPAEESPAGEEISPPPQPESRSVPGFLQGLLNGTKNAGITGIFEKLGLHSPDKGDILLVLILIYLYHESGDEEWLIILALIFLMGLGPQ